MQLICLTTHCSAVELEVKGPFYAIVCLSCNDYCFCLFDFAVTSYWYQLVNEPLIVTSVYRLAVKLGGSHLCMSMPRSFTKSAVFDLLTFAISRHR